MASEGGDAAASEAKATCSILEACNAAKAEGNAAFQKAELDAATEHYTKALSLWEQAAQATEQPTSMQEGQLVRYDKRNFFGVVMSTYPMFNEYFLKDLGSDKAIWAGDAGGVLRRFAREEISAVTREALDLRQALAQNLAAVYLKRENWLECVKWCDAALVIEGKAPKALLRKGAALLNLNKPGPASDVLATCMDITPKDAECRRLLREAEARRSPTWVCAKGCCGPWGIVCGGPVVTSGANSIAVPPSEKPKEKVEEKLSAVTIAPNFKQAPPANQAEDTGSTSSGSAPATPRGDTKQSVAAGEPNGRTIASSAPAANVAAVQAASRTQPPTEEKSSAGTAAVEANAEKLRVFATSASTCEADSVAAKPANSGVLMFASVAVVILSIAVACATKLM
eukprot:TRINITY_DN38049_c0_g2_i1.p1 TRINITY_DN38049_c0_g2~~TRINITY_DN38049_c0_g2_i1.p1  ORF type:complete len:398 (+),score=70.79 TRINITY_DN38049_c0_g2_i1:67-1260(+)